ncbi:hypothetical protein TGAM01_v207323 [Trichoderma gamsii]|uniref:C2H2-type domain-containing protein n=1 Tax=Trichoderma gamsii TaxID=398673 RepID=A0A2P4ZHB4_9HYPO|nr:hypothetical protein TGAM01_v207323 [Trichoderma gamsii]PON23676.1 hypothetical protein TGAM01_v207323 [Trichoderma gamsii]
MPPQGQYQYEFEGPSPYVTLQCPQSAILSSVSSNSSPPYEVFTPISRRSTSNEIRMDFDDPYQYASTPTPPAVVMPKYLYPVHPVKAEHECMSFSSSDGTLSPSTPHRKMHGFMSHEYILDVNSINSHSMGSISPSGPVHAYTEASLPSTSYNIMTPTHSVSPSEIVESNGTTWCNSDSPIFFRPKQQSPQHVEPLNLHQRYSESPMGQRYNNNYHPHSQSPHRLASQRGPAWNAAVMTKSAHLQETIRIERKVVPEKNDPGSYDVVRKAMCKCDYPNCHKAFRRNEHLKRHKQTFHGEGPNRFSCEFCGKDQFNRQDNLNNHRKLHARPNSRNRGVEFIAAAVPVIEQEERSRKRRAPPKSRLPVAGMPAEKRAGSY